MKVKHIFLLLFVAVIAVTSCKRKNIRGDLKNRREILQSSDWKLVSIKSNGGNTSLPACQDDNYYHFEPGGTGRYMEGEVNCLDSTGAGNAPTYTPFLWQVTGDLRYIYFLEYGGDPDAKFEWDIQNMTFEKLKVTQQLYENGKDIILSMEFAAMPK